MSCPQVAAAQPRAPVRGAVGRRLGHPVEGGRAAARRGGRAAGEEPRRALADLLPRRRHGKGAKLQKKKEGKMSILHADLQCIFFFFFATLSAAYAITSLFHRQLHLFEFTSLQDLQIFMKQYLYLVKCAPPFCERL